MEELLHSLQTSVVDTLLMKNNFSSINISQNIYMLFAFKIIVIIFEKKKRFRVIIKYYRFFTRNTIRYN